MNLDLIKDNTLIICNNTYKNNLLKLLTTKKMFLNVKFLTIKDFLNKVLYSYDEKTIYYIFQKYKYKNSIIKKYLDNLVYVDATKKYNNSKLDFLVNLKQELLKNNLLKKDELFVKSLKNTNILVYDDASINNYHKNILNNYNVTYFKVENKNYPLKEVNKFNDIEAETLFVIKNICKLISSGEDINNIKIIASSDYNITLEKITTIYNIPLKLNNKTSLYALNIGKDFINNYQSDIQKTLDSLKKYDSLLVNKIVAICNKYYFVSDYNLVKELIIDDLKNTYLDNYSFANAVEVTTLDYPYHDEYVFFMGFNNANIPMIIHDEDYLLDKERLILNIDTTSLINKKVKELTINSLKNIKNLVLSYSLNNSIGVCYPSSLIEELSLKEVTPKNNICESYSLLNDKLTYASLMDNYYKFGNKDDNLKIYQNNLDISYNKFDNKFKGINNQDLKDYLGKLTLSYSSLSNYNKCPFRYYISNILKLEKYEEKFEAYIGSIFHDVLEKCFNNDLDIDTEVENYIKESGREITTKERFFIDKIKQDITFVIDVLKKQNEFISLNQAKYEENFVINKDRNNFKVDFIGFVDKLLYKENSHNTMVAIIDYKTGYVDIDLKYLPYGMSMQLPIYLYLVKKSAVFNNPVFLGFYLQYILDKDTIIDPKKSYLTQREDKLKLVGYSNDDQDYLEYFDSSYQDSNLIKSMKTKKDGNFGMYAKVLNNEQINKIIDLTEENIEEGINNILEANFAIKPKQIGKDKVGCKFCKFKDICFVKEEDFNVLEEINDISFLGGDNNA